MSDGIQPQAQHRDCDGGDFLLTAAAAPVLDARLVLAHGAGAGMESDFMNAIAEAVTRRGVAVIRFEFPYMAQRRRGGKRRPPDRADTLLRDWRRVVQALRPGPPLFVGGKSLGGRMASMVADELAVAGLVCLGYPFHPPRQPQRLRTEHLAGLHTPALIVQGSRDPFGNCDEVRDYSDRGLLADHIRLQWLEDGDHDFRPRVRSGLSQADHIETAAQAIAAFVAATLATAAPGGMS
ncbi:alpha/beta fold hydrolase [Exilibacterium tricleocarpae]|uniref:Alpha/beta fold hydrolase n=1 Tax=Exilibacterium tricleocarpae TaxID=2591008 RepID=A0A545SS82_9GAMM|nr:alpha/beta family hydrolase [Exilibacterium tricleocarpae]TQV67776.1 alpha/beta fold hydrolase [Exilibacterium tricleocarpae]